MGSPALQTYWYTGHPFLLSNPGTHDIHTTYPAFGSGIVTILFIDLGLWTLGLKERKRRNDKDAQIQRDKGICTVWKKKVKTRHDLVAEQRVSLPSDWPPKTPKLRYLRLWKWYDQILTVRRNNFASISYSKIMII